MNKLLRIIIIFFVIVLAAGSVSNFLEAMNWPSENAVLVRNFGANNSGKPVLGMIFAGETEILAVENGEVIFSRSEKDTASRLPSPLGSWTAIDHGDGLISIYGRYDESNRIITSYGAEDLENQIDKQQQIAFSGISGWSVQEGFYFKLFDRRERRWINPAMIIAPVQETRPPQILSVSLRNTQGLAVQTNNLTQGRYTVVVNIAGGTPVYPASRGFGSAVTASLSSNQYAPQRIYCSVNGAEVGSLNFEAVFARDGVQMVSRNGLVPARQIYAYSPAYEAAEVFLNRGQARLEVIVHDRSGNSHNTVLQLTVN